MDKITILGVLIVIDKSDDNQNKNVTVRKTPTLDDLFTYVFREGEKPDESWKEQMYGEIFP